MGGMGKSGFVRKQTLQPKLHRPEALPTCASWLPHCKGDRRSPARMADLVGLATCTNPLGDQANHSSVLDSVLITNPQ